jgi:SAM-dependent methyltransferase
MTTAVMTEMRVEDSVNELYRKRFPAEMLQRRAAVWQVICDTWLNRYVPANGRVLEIACGYCEFINHVQAASKVGIDLNPEARLHAHPDVAVHIISAERLHESLPASSFDVAFTSNFLEHCRSRDQVLHVLQSAATVLKPGGRLLILGPNFRYCYREYFDYFDHYLPLSERAVVEALQIAGYEVEEASPRTLPFTFRSRLPSWPWLVKLYLQMPLAWRFFGQQFLIVARKS